MKKSFQQCFQVIVKGINHTCNIAKKNNLKLTKMNHLFQKDSNNFFTINEGIENTVLLNKIMLKTTPRWYFFYFTWGSQSSILDSSTFYTPKTKLQKKDIQRILKEFFGQKSKKLQRPDLLF